MIGVGFSAPEVILWRQGLGLAMFGDSSRGRNLYEWEEWGRESVVRGRHTDQLFLSRECQKH